MKKLLISPCAIIASLLYILSLHAYAQSMGDASSTQAAMLVAPQATGSYEDEEMAFEEEEMMPFEEEEEMPAFEEDNELLSPPAVSADPNTPAENMNNPAYTTPYHYYYNGEKIYLTKDEDCSNEHNTLCFKRSDDGSVDPIRISDIFYVELKSQGDSTQLKEVAEQKNTVIVKHSELMPLWYQLKVNDSTRSSLEVGNEFYETGYFADVDPAFMFNFSPNCSNDPDFGSLWGLQNSADTTLDINACEAWTITEGSGVTVAVVDQGVDKTHNDLNDNISSLSYDAVKASSPSKYTAGQNHGTQVAGVIAAEKDNNLQVVGMAPQTEIMVVSHHLYFDYEASSWEMADGIKWAWENGADVINNSWGDQGGWLKDLHSFKLDMAIKKALNEGRDGLGTVMVFAAGNHGYEGDGSVDYPAYVNKDILAVGAMNRVGNRPVFSAYGKELDVVAPGVEILTTSADQGTKSVKGTSLAAPHAAGVAALILSLNPNLTAREVNTIIEATAQKVGGYAYANKSDRPNGTWHKEMGHGLIDAYAAVQIAQQSNSTRLFQIGNKGTIHNDESATFILLDGKDNADWNVSSNLKIVARSSNAVTVKVLDSMTICEGFVEAVSRGETIRKTIKVENGLPSIALPVITFTRADLTNTLLGRADSVEYDRYIVRQGEMVSFNVRGDSLNLSWKNVRRDLNSPQYESGDPPHNENTLLLPPPQLPDLPTYSPCRNIHGEGNSVAKKFELVDAYFNLSDVGAISDHHSPPIQFGFVIGGGLFEVELTASNECGCTTKANSYIVLGDDYYSQQFRSSFSMSPNPANTQLNITVEAPEREVATVDFVDIETGEITYVEIVSQDDETETYRYTLTIHNLITGETLYTQNFDLIGPSSSPPSVEEPDNTRKQIVVNTTDYPDGLYIVKLLSLTEEANAVRRLTIDH